jgi:hypothetical protein
MKLTGQRNQCRGCDQYFNSNVAFEKHRTGSFESGRRCKTPEEMTDRGMSLNAAGFWITAAMPTDKISTLKGTEDDAQEN